MSDEQQARQRRILRKEGLLRGYSQAKHDVRMTFREMNNEMGGSAAATVHEMLTVQRYTTRLLLKMEKEQKIMERDLDKEYREQRRAEPIEI